MSSRATRIAATILVIFLAMTAWVRVTSPRAEGTPPSPSPVLSGESDRDVVLADATALASEQIDAVDSYGNEVNRAVATYQFDATGSLYELHSPQTEVPKLRPPKTKPVSAAWQAFDYHSGHATCMGSCSVVRREPCRARYAHVQDTPCAGSN